jgi:hypothetical protein
MNNGNYESQLRNQNKGASQDLGSSPSTKMKKEASPKEAPAEPEGKADECKEIEYLKAILKNCLKSKRKLLIKPNLPAKWISDLKAKLAKIQSK